LIDDPSLGGGGMASGNLGSTMMADDVFLHDPTGASKSVSTTTSIINGHKHTVTKIQDANGVKIIEDYGDGQPRVTINGVEQQPAVAAQQQYIKEAPITTQEISTTQTPKSSPYNSGKWQYFNTRATL
jgi:hypothetical protein